MRVFPIATKRKSLSEPRLHCTEKLTFQVFSTGDKWSFQCFLLRFDWVWEDTHFHCGSTRPSPEQRFPACSSSRCICIARVLRGPCVKPRERFAPLAAKFTRINHGVVLHRFQTGGRCLSQISFQWMDGLPRSLQVPKTCYIPFSEVSDAAAPQTLMIPTLLPHEILHSVAAAGSEQAWCQGNWSTIC